jgi:hypothetical protein
MHRDVIDAESINDLFPVYLAEHFVVDRPDIRTVAERAVLRTHDKFLSETRIRRVKRFAVCACRGAEDQAATTCAVFCRSLTTAFKASKDGILSMDWTLCASSTP